MAHDHDSPKLNYNRAFALGIILNVFYVAVEVGYGLYINSLALLADAGHNASDVLSLVLAWGGYWLSQRPPTKQYTFGLGGSTILAALFNALLLLGAVGAIVWESVGRLNDPPSVAPGTVMIVAGIGVAINLGTTLLFLTGRKSDLNVRGAFLHMAADTLVSVGVVLGGLMILLTGWERIDPILSLLIAVVIFVSTWGLLRDSVKLAVHAVPSEIDIHKVEEWLRSRPGVTELHDLHVWGMSTTSSALMVHLVRPESTDDPDEFLEATSRELHERFGIDHVTVQVERLARPEYCPQAKPGSV